MSVFNIGRGFIFIHIPKTAGSSMETVDWVGKGYNKHEGIAFYQNIVHGDEELDLKNYFKWTFVRDPYDRFMSGLLNHVFKGRYIDNTAGDERKGVRKWVKTHQNFRQIEVLRPMHEYMEIDGKNVMDFIGRFENLQEDFNTVCEKIGVEPTKLPHINKGRHRNYDHLWDNEIREIVGDYYSKDFDLFDYEI